MTKAPETHEYTNRLIDSTSPYLLQHAHNPVDWYPWGEEALERAREEDKLILLSIGYSACHWCHVMERESFEDEETAALMNEHFINIKVDREERPDLDEIYMAATVAMNHGQGGWPMTVFLTPDLEPVFAGTYFPPEDQYGRPGFRSVLRQVARAWNEDRETLKSQASRFSEQLRSQRRARPPLPVGEDELRRALEEYSGAFDPTYGGFGPAPKFPPAVSLQLLLRLHRRLGESHALRMVEVTLDGMARGGMYDHVGGGFARYSTDNRWLVPHFEKMLYDNALLARAYLEGFQVTDDEFYAEVATETLDYILRDMTSSEGGFYSSTDADSEGQEGVFFVWTPEQVKEVLDEDDARLFCNYYDIRPGGNWEGVSIPNTPRPLHAVAQSLGIDPDEAAERIDEARARVFEARERRVKPGLDDKVITAWNGLMISAFAEAYRILGEERYLRAAEAAADFIFSTLQDEDGRLLRTYRAGQAHLPAHLEDYAYLAEGLLDLYEAGGAPRRLNEATDLVERVLDEFTDPESGAFYSTSRQHEKLLLRYQDGADGATPAANAVAASVLARLAHHLDRAELREAAISAISAYGRMIKRFPRGFAKSLCAVDFLLEPPVELALVGARGSADLKALQRAAAAHYLPNRVQATFDPEADPADAAELPLLRGKTTVDGKAALYLCRDYACQAPVTDPDEAEELIMAREGEESESVRVLASPLPGQATSEGTRRYAGRHTEKRYRDLGSTGLATGVLGFGSYRVDDSTPAHREALKQALTSGVNLIDTATNYTDGGSERLIGGVLQQLVKAEGLSRDELIVVSKIGYVQGSNYRLAREREARGEPFPEMLKIEEGLWHCIHPEFLEDQLGRSLERLQLDTLDVCLLHNPEYFLSEAVRQGERLDEARDEFYSRLQRAFAYFESQIDAGRLAFYGMSSNAAASPSGPDAPSLTRTLQAARAAGGDEHGFRALQLPANLFESAAALERGAGPDENSTVLEIAQRENIAVLANRPLNAFAGGKIFRLADIEVESSSASPDDLLEHLEVLEDEFRATIAAELQVSQESLDPTSFFDLAPRLQEMRKVIQGIAHWSQLEGHVRHTVLRVAAALDRQLRGELGERWSDWRGRYLSALEDVFREVRIEASEATRERNAAVSEVLDPLLPEDRQSESLSRKALWVAASTPGVHCVLTGMRTPEYVEDAIGMMGWSPLEDVEPIYQALKSLA